MKISLNNITTYHTEFPPVAKATAKNTNTEKAGRSNYDAIIIQSDSRQIAEKTFSSSLAQAVSGEVQNTQTPEQKIQDIKEQVHNGTYQVQFDKIASRMLFPFGGVQRDRNSEIGRYPEKSSHLC